MIRTLLGAACVAMLSTAALADPVLTIGNINLNTGDTQNVASQLQLGVSNFQLLAQGFNATTEGLGNGQFQYFAKSLVEVSPNASSVIAIYNTGFELNLNNTLNGALVTNPIDQVQVNMN